MLRIPRRRLRRGPSRTDHVVAASVTASGAAILLATIVTSSGAAVMAVSGSGRGWIRTDGVLGAVGPTTGGPTSPAPVSSPAVADPTPSPAGTQTAPETTAIVAAPGTWTDSDLDGMVSTGDVLTMPLMTEIMQVITCAAATASAAPEAPVMATIATSTDHSSRVSVQVGPLPGTCGADIAPLELGSVDLGTASPAGPSLHFAAWLRHDHAAATATIVLGDPMPVPTPTTGAPSDEPSASTGPANPTSAPSSPVFEPTNSASPTDSASTTIGDSDSPGTEARP